ncbi:hypothetical protein [Chryseolinea sp. H1M3-3]|uniref:hypothetical protein n=1 Tax=Chryseolinea sp. H1M3-3 TaxID=3034144 RepID=UPI0023EBF784|nr:hypothetical protein [Chryseolinea sp. H1M3-3]
MNKRTRYTRLGKFFGVFFLLLIVHHFVIRPWMLDWGAPKKIEKLTLSGDRFINGRSHTRAVLIHTTPDKIWPWLVQMGQERGGMYSYTWLENIVLADMKNTYVIRPEFQKPRMQGDTIWLANKRRYKGKGHQIFAEVIPEKSVIMVGDQDYMRIQNGQTATGAWSFYLVPQDEESTWLIARSTEDETIGKRVLRYFTYEIPHFIMEQKMLRTVKRLSEA